MAWGLAGCCIYHKPMSSPVQYRLRTVLMRMNTSTTLAVQYTTVKLQSVSNRTSEVGRPCTPSADSLLDYSTNINIAVAIP